MYDKLDTAWRQVYFTCRGPLPSPILLRPVARAAAETQSPKSRTRRAPRSGSRAAQSLVNLSDRSILKWIHDANTSVPKVDNVARCDRQSMRQCCGCNQTIFDRHCGSVVFQTNQERGPSRGSVDIEIKGANPFDSLGKPLSQPRASSAVGQQLNSILKLAKDNGSDRQFRFVAAEPFYGARIFGAGFVGSLNTPASTRNFTACPSTPTAAVQTNPSPGRQATSLRGRRCERPAAS